MAAVLTPPTFCGSLGTAHNLACLDPTDLTTHPGLSRLPAVEQTAQLSPLRAVEQVLLHQVGAPARRPLGLGRAPPPPLPAALAEARGQSNSTTTSSTSHPLLTNVLLDHPPPVGALLQLELAALHVAPAAGRAFPRRHVEGQGPPPVLTPKSLMTMTMMSLIALSSTLTTTPILLMAWTTPPVAALGPAPPLPLPGRGRRLQLQPHCNGVTSTISTPLGSLASVNGSGIHRTCHTQGSLRLNNAPHVCSALSSPALLPATALRPRPFSKASAMGTLRRTRRTSRLTALPHLFACSAAPLHPPRNAGALGRLTSPRAILTLKESSSLQPLPTPADLAGGGAALPRLCPAMRDH